MSRRAADGTSRRVARVAAGAAELEHRLTDALHAGLAAAPAQRWGEVAARMVDAQAPGLAARVRELDGPAATGPEGPARLLEEYALLHLLAAGCRRLGELPAPLAATVRARAGFTVEAAAVWEGPRVRDRWLVLGVSEAAEGVLESRRTWLRGAVTGRPALLLRYAGPGRAPEPALPLGCEVEAELAYYPGTPPLRAVFDPAGPPAPAAAPDAGGTPSPPPGTDVAAALDAYGAALADDPWLDDWPVVLRDVVPLPAAAGWQLADAAGRPRAAVPIDRRAGTGSGLWRLAALSGGRPLTVFGTCGHLGLRPVTAWAPDAEGVPIPVDVTR